VVAKNEQLTSEKESIERDLSTSLQAGPWTDVLAGVDATAFCRRLKSDEALVDIFLYNYAGTEMETGLRYAAIITNGSHPPVLVDLGSHSTTDSAVKTWRSEVMHGQQAAESWQDLVNKIWEPIEAVLPAAAKKIWLCPDAELSLVPWHLFPSAADNTKALVVCQADSARELANLRQRQESSASKSNLPGLLLAGGIDFDANLGKGPPSASDNRSLISMNPLPGTLVEITQLDFMAKSKGYSVTKFTGADATKKAVMAALPQADFVHLATHGYFLGDSWLQHREIALLPESCRECLPACRSECRWECRWECRPNKIHKRNRLPSRRRSLPRCPGTTYGLPPGLLPGATRTINIIEKLDTESAVHRNPLVESGIAFAGANHFEVTDLVSSSLLTAEELVGWT